MFCFCQHVTVFAEQHNQSWINDVIFKRVVAVAYTVNSYLFGFLAELYFKNVIKSDETVLKETMNNQKRT
jgi:hypothetical protein